MPQITRGEVRDYNLTGVRLGAPKGFEIDPNPLTLTYGDDVYAVAMTARASTTDGKQIPITGSAVTTARKACPEANETALIFSWVEEDGSLGAVVLTLEQHEKLSAIDSPFGRTKRSNGEIYYYADRAAIGHADMAVYADLAAKKEILFVVSLKNQR